MSKLRFERADPRIALLVVCLTLSAPFQTLGRSPFSRDKWQWLQPNPEDSPNTDHHHVSGSVVASAENADIRLQFLPAGEPVPAAAQVVAQASYVDSLHTKSNFGKLRVVANDDQHLGQELRYRAAGFAEGFLTAGAIWDHFRNTRDYFKTDLYPGVDIWDAPMKWLHKQEAWVLQQLAAQTGSTSGSTSPEGGSSGSISSSSSSSKDSSQGSSSSGSSDFPASSNTGSTRDADALHAQIWSGVALQMAQFNGIVEGYAARRQEALRLLQQQGQTPCADGDGSGGEGVGASSTGAAAGRRQGVECTHHVSVPGAMSRDDHLFLQNNGELYDIVDGMLAGAWGEKPGPDVPGSLRRGGSSRDSSSSSSGNSEDSYSRSPLSPGKWLQDLALKGHCSALIKVAADLSDIYVGHATWDSYTQALRIYKHYDLGGPGFGRLSFSSYPGETFSDDDFYLSESGLVVLETTDHIFNPKVYAGLSTETLLSWQRVRTALMLAHSGEEWLSIFKYKNSGTYNNQYMVVDLNKFEPKQRLAPGLLWVVEQLPGMIEAGDMTFVLSQGHWGSYNVPSFTKIYNASGYPEELAAINRDQSKATDEATREKYEVAKRWLMYQAAPRANIYRRNQNVVDVRFANSFDGSLDEAGISTREAGSLDGSHHHESDLDGMKALMRYNNYREDKFSYGSPMEAVCSRGDLPDQGGWGLSATSTVARGCYDGKVTNYRLASRLQSEVVNGPTRSHGLPPFSWKEWLRNSNMTIHGHPATFDFDWERMNAEDLPLPQHPGGKPALKRPFLKT